jgi:methyltransferase (TIGR00027 family)
MPEEAATVPDTSAVRVALWRALHREVDAPPHVLEDDVALRLADPEDGWRQRPDMDPDATRGFRAAIVARARFVEDLLVAERVAAGTRQYVILGAGLDTFAQRRLPSMGSDLRVFEIDQPATQAWKRQRLVDLGYEIPDCLHFVPVDFEAGASWREQLEATDFDSSEPAVIASTGVSMYLTKDAIASTLSHVAALAPGTTLAMSFLLPLESLDGYEQPTARGAERGARTAGTPWLSFFTPEEMIALARVAGFVDPHHLPGAVLAERYFTGRTDGLRPARGEDLLLATTT